VKTILELAENKKAENADSDVKKNEVKTILELAENKKMEKTRKVNVQEIPKIQRVENDDYIHYVEASDTKFLSKVQKKAPIENKEAKNDDHIDDSNPKILPIISQQAVKKNGEVKTILELAENKKAENTDLDVKKNEEVKTILELAENKKAENADSGVKKNEEAKIILERAEIRGNEEENSGEHEEENSGEHEEENSGELEEENSGEHEVVLNQVGGPVAEVIGESIGESIDDASEKVGKAVAVMKKKITTLKKKMKHKKESGTFEAMDLKKPYAVMTLSNFVTIVILIQLEPFNLFLKKRQFNRLIGKSDTVNQSASLPLADIYNLINLIISFGHLIRVCVVNIDWPSNVWEIYEIFGLLIFNTSLIFRVMAICGPILWNFLVYHLDIFRVLCDDEYEEVFSNDLSIGLSICTLIFLSLLTPWFITHIIPMAILYAWLPIIFIAILLGYLKARREWIDRRKGNQIYNTFIKFLDKYIFGQGTKLLRKWLFQMYITVALQLFLNYGVRFYMGDSYFQVCKNDFYSRNIRNYWTKMSMNWHRKIEMVTMLL